MSKTVIIICLFLWGTAFAVKAQEMSEKEKTGYAIGVMLVEKIKSSGTDLSFVESLKESGLLETLKESGFLEALRDGFRDAFKGEYKLSMNELQTILGALKEKMDAIQKQGKEPEKKEENESQPSVNYQITIARHYAAISWYSLFLKEFIQSEQSARKALELDGTYLIPKTNLAHALLFQNRFSDAKAIYEELSRTIYQDNETYTKTLLEDFDELEKAGVIPEGRHEDIEKIKKILQP